MTVDAVVDVDVLPDFVVVGAQKSASTMLARALAEHPDVYMPERETLFFRDLEYAAGTLSDLARLMLPGRAVLHRGIRCPEYLSEASCAARIHRDLRSPRIIATLRDPVARAVSAYFWYMRWGLVPLRPLEEGMRELLGNGYQDYRPVADQILTFGRYAEGLRRYFDLWEPSQIHVSTDIDLRSDAAGVLRSIWQFLGLRSAPIPPVLEQRLNPGVYSLTRLRLNHARNRLIVTVGPETDWVRVRRPKARGRRVLNAGLAAADRYVLARLLPAPPPRSSARLRAELIDYYREDIARTEQLIGRDLSAWTRTQP